MAKKQKQQFPAWMYHHKKKPEGQIFQSAAEFKAAGSGWVDTPAKFPRSRARTVVLKRIKPWWLQWEWLFKGCLLLVTLVAGVIGIIQIIKTGLFQIEKPQIVWVGSFSNDNGSYFLNLRPANPQIAVAMADFEFPFALQRRLKSSSIDLYSKAIDITYMRARLGEILTNYTESPTNTRFAFLRGFPGTPLPAVISSRYTLADKSYSDRSLYFIPFGTELGVEGKGKMTFHDIEFKGLVWSRSLQDGEDQDALLKKFWRIKTEPEELNKKLPVPKLIFR